LYLLTPNHIFRNFISLSPFSDLNLIKYIPLL
jgi:hypothetical protein